MSTLRRDDLRYDVLEEMSGRILDLVFRETYHSPASAPAAYGISLEIMDGPNGEADYTENFTGTSAAAPQVASAAVLIISLDQSMLGSDVRSRILDTSDYWGDPQDFGAGKLNVGAALELSVEIAGPSSVGQEETCTWTADAAGGDPSYSYEWYRDNSFVGTGDEYTAGTGTSDFLLRVDVTDQQGTIRSDDLYVTVEGEPLCEA